MRRSLPLGVAGKASGDGRAATLDDLGEAVLATPYGHGVAGEPPLILLLFLKLISFLSFISNIW